MHDRTNRISLALTRKTAVLLGCALAAQTAVAGDFLMSNDSSDTLDGVGFEQRWTIPALWTLTGGVDDGGDGIPNGTDTITMNRNGNPSFGDTDLSNEFMPDHSLAKLTGTGAPGRDVVLKFTGELTLGDLEVLASPDSFLIQMERDQDLLINGVISGAGDLELNRAGSFTDGVTPDEVITIGGSSANTITGAFKLRNNNTAGIDSYWVADKVGAFGQTSLLTLEGASGSGITQLLFTGNTTGGEGAIDDDATAVLIGNNGIFSVDSGVDEVIGSGLLTVDGLGVIADGTYTNAESWITGAGSITVGGGSNPFDPADLDQDGDVDDADFGIAFAAFTGPGGGPSSNPAADLDNDGDVDDADFGIAFAAFTGPGGAAVPEPASLALLGLGGLLIARRRRA